MDRGEDKMPDAAHLSRALHAIIGEG